MGGPVQLGILLRGSNQGGDPAIPAAYTDNVTQGLPQEFLDAIAPQFNVKPVKKGMNPLFVLIIGGGGVVLLLAIAGLATFMLSGS